jgi:hypothetical protein
MPPNKLKAGFGEGVCTVLLALCTISVQNKFKFRKPIIRDDGAGFGGDDDGDDMGDEFEGNADVADMVREQASDGDDIDEDYDFGGVGGMLAGELKKNEEDF